MSKLSGTGPQVVSQNLFFDSSTQLHRLGELVHSNDGRSFRYCKAGGSALVAGNLQQSSAEDTGDQDVAIAAASVGDTSITTTGSLTLTANQYAEGFALITTSDGVGYIYPVSGHAAVSSSTVTINLAQAIDVALTTSSKLDLIKNPYDSVIINPTSPTGPPVGVALIALTASQFGWLQVAGPGIVESEGGSTVGVPQVVDDGDAGCVADIADGANELDAKVGVALTGIADGEFGAVKLELL